MISRKVEPGDGPVDVLGNITPVEGNEESFILTVAVGEANLVPAEELPGDEFLGVVTETGLVGEDRSPLIVPAGDGPLDRCEDLSRIVDPGEGPLVLDDGV